MPKNLKAIHGVHLNVFDIRLSTLTRQKLKLGIYHDYFDKP